MVSMKGLSDSGQLFTIEGLTAAIIMLVSAYIVLGSGMILTPGDVHISDMQLEQLGNDALLMMDTQDTYDGENSLSDLLKTNNKTGFDTLFTGYLKKSTGSTPFVDSLRYNSTVYSTDSLGNLIDPAPFIGNSDNPGRSPAIRCGRYVTTDWGGTGSLKIIRLEVLIWRD